MKAPSPEDNPSRATSASSGGGGRSSFCDSNETVRKRRAAKLAALLASRTDLSRSRVIDIGTGSGHVAAELGKSCGELVSVDVWDQRVAKEGFAFALMVDGVIPFEDASFDVVISNQVYEHVMDQNQHLAEMDRVLKPGGWGHLATPNRLCLIEPHYNLPFLGWFPPRLAGWYLKAAKGKVWDVRLVSWWELRRKARRYFQVEDRAPEVLRNPHAYHLDISPTAERFFRHCPLPMVRAISPFMPSFLFTLFKPPQRASRD